MPEELDSEEPGETVLPRPRRRRTEEEFRELMREARQEARRLRYGRPPEEDSAVALSTQHAEFGAAAH
ncbi:hypothetical protein E5082_10935 [Streptomyces griseoluteus]|uniref:Uncharacterized protein n=1 Tax=Streptomyces griseoluteus TaxID=29306 RepID=A0A4Z1DKV5_STRGP|nr:hypothetical protein [Streptomyces griseoluteus]TGN84850.1 hypothetical protein E5082_10935 [Streptomyces griseoluteus]